MRVERLSNNPIIQPHMDARMGANINGPSLIRAPDWLENPLGRYYLYFGHHKGEYIRLAFADELTGPWTIYQPGVLDLKDAYTCGHLASPDVHVDNENHEVRMYYHGPVPKRDQQSKVALSSDGIHFTARPENLGNSYFRAFQWQGEFYALAMPGVFYRSADGLTDFEKGPTLFSENQRHTALKLEGSRLSVFYTNVSDCPERILCAAIDLTLDWMEWRVSEPLVILEPETDYEGADLSLRPSVRGWSPERVCQLRDPGIYREANETYLLYSVAGESGIAIARLLGGNGDCLLT